MPAHSQAQLASGTGQQGLNIPFGKAAREQLFTLEPGVTYLNHGSYGGAFKLALQTQAWLRVSNESDTKVFRFRASKTVIRAKELARRKPGSSQASNPTTHLLHISAGAGGTAASAIHGDHCCDRWAKGHKMLLGFESCLYQHYACGPGRLVCPCNPC